jgi:hypothetical protein
VLQVREEPWWHTFFYCKLQQPGHFIIASTISITMLYETLHRRQNGKVVIVDWDDTILPSTFVDRWQIENSRDLPLHVSVVICIVMNDVKLAYNDTSVACNFVSQFSSIRLMIATNSFKISWRNLPSVPIDF